MRRCEDPAAGAGRQEENRVMDSRHTGSREEDTAADSGRKKRNDMILAAALLAAALVAYAGFSLAGKSADGSGEAVVLVDGEEYARYPLSEDASARIELPGGKYNLLKIAGGEADMTGASCPDQICVRHRPVRMPGESLVCLPNRVVVEIREGEGADAQVDAVTH